VYILREKVIIEKADVDGNINFISEHQNMIQWWKYMGQQVWLHAFSTKWTGVVSLKLQPLYPWESTTRIKF
jgi:hypothetical protein